MHDSAAMQYRSQRSVTKAGRATAAVAFFFFQGEGGIRDLTVTGVQTCALPICARRARRVDRHVRPRAVHRHDRLDVHGARRSEEHTSELQSQSNLVCRLLLEKKKKPHHVLWPSNTNAAARQQMGTAHLSTSACF